MSSKLALSLASAALMGLLVGCGEEEVATPAPTATEDAAPDAVEADVKAAEGEQPAEATGHACKGMNECKGMGGCGVEGAHDCAGKNECKTKGGCCTMSNKDDCPTADAMEAGGEEAPAVGEPKEAPAGGAVEAPAPTGSKKSAPIGTGTKKGGDETPPSTKKDTKKAADAPPSTKK